LWDLSGKLHPSDVAAKRRWVMSHQHFLDDGKIEPLANRLRALGTERQELAEDIETEANYFERNAARMRYPKFRRQGLLVGSGVIEAGCKTLIATRLKRSGMFWTVRGANAVIAVIAAVTVVNSTIIGSPDGHDCPFQVAHPSHPAEIRRIMTFRVP
jgi:hypothetical protein